MSRSDTVTKLPLATWAKYMGLNPLHFEQVRIDGFPPLCSNIYFQHEWQTADHVSREEIARAIAEAEYKIESALGYRLAPSWEVDEWHPTQRYFRSELVNYNSADIRGLKQIVQADWGWLISGGMQVKSLISAGVVITYSDEDGDSLEETATVIVATTAVDPNEIGIYYPGKSGDDTWEIRPTEVTISGGNATIVFRREYVVIEEKLEAFDNEGAEALYNDDTAFLSVVDVYRRYNDPQTQVSFLWEPFASGTCGSCGGSGCPICAYTIQTGCLILRGDPRSSLVGFSPASWNQDTLDFDIEPWAVARQPDIVRLYYYAGLRDKRSRYVSRMSQDWERTVAYMAAAMLDRPPCDCGADVWNHYRQDLTLTSGDEDGRPFFRPAQGIEDNPFGTRRGEVDAWRKVRSFSSQRMTAVAL